MAEVWLNGRSPGFPSLKTVLQNAGQVVVELAGYDWSVNSRQSDTQGFPQPGPYGWVYHHTASCLACAANDHRYLCLTHASRPVSNVLLGMRNGVPTWHLVAAGAANTNGAGPGRQTSIGWVPTDQGNHYMGATEISINGVGEVWPKPLTDASIVGHAAILKAYRMKAVDLISHREWAGPRKSDPAGPTQDTTLGVSTGNTTPWNMNPLRTRVAAVMAGGIPDVPTIPPVTPPGGTMLVGAPNNSPAGTFTTDADFITKRWITSETEAKELFGADYTTKIVRKSFATLDAIPNVGSVPAGWTDHRPAAGAGDGTTDLVIPPEGIDFTGKILPA